MLYHTTEPTKLAGIQTIRPDQRMTPVWFATQVWVCRKHLFITTCKFHFLPPQKPDSNVCIVYWNIHQTFPTAFQLVMESSQNQYKPKVLTVFSSSNRGLINKAIVETDKCSKLCPHKSVIEPALSLFSGLPCRHGLKWSHS